MRNKGKHQYDKWKRGERLTYRDAVLAKCFDCAGNKVKDCEAKAGCPLWSVMRSKQPRLDKRNKN